MAFDVQWLDENEKSILHVQVIGRWQWREFDNAVMRVDVLAEKLAQQRPIRMIFDISEMSLLPPDFARRFKTDYLKRDIYVSCVAVLGADQYIRIIWSILKKLHADMKLHVVFVDSIEEAVALLPECREQPV